MFLSYDERMTILNLSNVCLVKAIDQPIPKEEGEPEIAHLLVYVFAGGVAEPVRYPDAQTRNNQYQALQEQLTGNVGVSSIVPVRLHPAQHNGKSLIESR